MLVKGTGPAGWVNEKKGRRALRGSAVMLDEKRIKPQTQSDGKRNARGESSTKGAA